MRSLTPKQLSRLGIAAIVFGWILFGVLSLPHYGISVDSPALFYAGDRTVFWLGNRHVSGVMDLKGNEPAGFSSPYGRSPAHEDPMHYPVFPGFIASLSAHLFSMKLGWLPDFEGRHLGLVLLNGFGLALFGLYACRFFGAGVGLFATLALTLYPSAIAGGMNNPKDWPSALFYGVGVLAAGVALVEDRARHLLAAGLLFGLSLSSKLNGAFGVATVIAWTPIAWLLLYARRRKVEVPMAGAWLLFPQIAFALFIVLWPWLWTGSISDLFNRLADYLSFLASYGQGARSTWTSYPFKAVFGYTPPFLFLLAIVGATFGFLRALRDHVSFARWTLVAVWLGLILFRMAAPHSNFYDGNRHFIEYVPALACLAALGAEALAIWLWGIAGRTSVAVLGAIALADLIVPIARYHPYEVAYFTPLIGGLGGAQEKRWLYVPPPQDGRTDKTEGDYWHSSTADAMVDLRKVWKPGQKFAYCGPWEEQIHATWGNAWKDCDTAKKADWIVQGYRNDCGDSAAETKDRPLVFEVKRDGGLIYRIWGKKLQ